MRGLMLRAGIATGLATLAVGGIAQAATLNVTKTGDPVPDGCKPRDCSLREAVRRANATAANDRIVLKARTYRLEQVGPADDDATAGDLDVVGGSGLLKIAGKGRGKTTIDGNDVDRIFDVLAGGRLSLVALALQDGNAGGFAGGALINIGITKLRNVAVRSSFAGSVGGAILNELTGRLRVSRSLIAGNAADIVAGAVMNQDDARATFTRTRIAGNEGDIVGGAIYNQNNARMTISRSRIAGNESGGSGGAIYNQNDARMTIGRSRIAGNETGGNGGGIYNQNDAQMVIARSKVIGNRAIEAGRDGGGIYNQNQALLRISRSQVNGNRADDDGGGIFNQNEARLTINRSTISGNRTFNASPAFGRGGGIFAQNDSLVRVTASTVSGNSSPTNGGGIFAQNDAVVVLTNSTISGNRADEGGGIHMDNFATAFLRFSTIARNRADTAGGGIFEDNGIAIPSDPQPPYVRPRGAIVAQNAAPSGRNCLVTTEDFWDSEGSNLENGASCPFDAGSDQLNANPGLRKLKKNGGPTKTHALKPASDAVNAARKQGCPDRDQRGVKRPQGRRCDIGSYELKQR